MTTVLSFGIVRPLGGDTVEALAAKLGPLLGRGFSERDERGHTWLETELLGLTISLVLWRSASGELVLLRGIRAWAPEDSEALDISQAMIDLLDGAQLGTWRLVTGEDIEATAAFNAAVERMFDRSDGEP
jgi:hypothetical protein